jgi:hypothetical protein
MAAVPGQGVHLKTLVVVVLVLKMTLPPMLEMEGLELFELSGGIQLSLERFQIQIQEIINDT